MTARLFGIAASQHVHNRVDSRRFGRSPRIYLTLSSFLQTSHYHKMAEAGRVAEQDDEIVTWRNLEQVKKILLDEMECSDALLRALASNDLISSDDCHRISILQSRTNKASNLLDTLNICNVTLRKWNAICEVLIAYGCSYAVDEIKKIEDKMTVAGQEEHDLKRIKFGVRIGKIKMEADAEEVLRVINLQNPDDMSSVVPEIGFAIVATQPGCVEIFIYSKTDPAYTTIAKEGFCKEMIEQLFSLEKVGKKVETGQKITLVVKKNPFTSPLLDKQERKIENFSKVDVLTINHSFITSNLKNVGMLNQKLRSVLGQTENVGNGTIKVEEIFKLLKGCEAEKWTDFISLLKEVDNEEIAKRLEKTSCIECYRSTILANVENVLDEITTDLMEKTFEGHSYIPEVVKDVCIKSKGETARLVRAKSFLEYVLIKGSILVSFAKVFASSTTTILEYSPCMEHGCCRTDKQITDSEEVTFSYLVNKDEQGKYCLREIHEKNTNQQLEKFDEHEDNIISLVSGQTGVKTSEKIQKHSLEDGNMSGIKNKIQKNGIIDKMCIVQT